MDVTTETVAPRELEFTIRPQPEQVDEARRKAARKLAQRVRIPGFRPGKAPYGLVERTVGKELLTEEAAEILAPDLYKQVIEAGGYEPYDRPTLRVAQQEPLELKIRVPLTPTVELADYAKMRVEPEPEAQVTPEHEERLLNEVREQHGTWVPVARPAELGDQVTLDIRGVANGEQLFDQQGTALTLAETLSPPGFAEAIKGMEAGQTREFSLSYPDDFPQKGLAGKTVAFTVTLRELKERHLPELNDDLARSVGDYANLDELRAHLREGLKKQLDAETHDRLATRVLDQVVAESRVEYPNQALEQEIDRLLRQRENRLRRQGFTLEGYLRAIHKSMPQLRDELRPEAEEMLRRALVLRSVGRAEKIEVSTADVLAEADRIAAAYGEEAPAIREALVQQGAVPYLTDDVYARQALNRLVDVVTGKVEAAGEAAGEGEAETPAAGEQAPAEAPGE